MTRRWTSSIRSVPFRTNGEESGSSVRGGDVAGNRAGAGNRVQCSSGPDEHSRRGARVEVVSRDAPAEAIEPSAKPSSEPNGDAQSLESPVHQPARIQLAAGEQVAVTPKGEILANAGPPLERVRAWTERRLIFREERLSEVIAEFNRYHKQQLRIADPALAEHRISGTFAVQDVASLLQFLERYEQVEIEGTRDGRMLRRRSGSEHPAI